MQVFRTNVGNAFTKSLGWCQWQLSTELIVNPMPASSDWCMHLALTCTALLTSFCLHQHVELCYNLTSALSVTCCCVRLSDRVRAVRWWVLQASTCTHCIIHQQYCPMTCSTSRLSFTSLTTATPNAGFLCCRQCLILSRSLSWWSSGS